MKIEMNMKVDWLYKDQVMYNDQITYDSQVAYRSRVHGEADYRCLTNAWKSNGNDGRMAYEGRVYTQLIMEHGADKDVQNTSCLKD